MCCDVCVGQRTTDRSQFSPTLWILSVELRAPSQVTCEPWRQESLLGELGEIAHQSLQSLLLET